MRRLLARKFKAGNPYADTDRSLSSAGKTASPLPADLEEYIALCERGEFYESLMTAKELAAYHSCLKTDKAVAKCLRNKIKDRFWPVLFGKNQSRDPRFRNKMRDLFRERFPTVATFLRRLKSRDYRRSSYLLQNLEATIFIWRICGRILREQPGIPLYPIHDCLLTTPPNVGYVRSVILDEVRKLGIEPTLKITSYGLIGEKGGDDGAKRRRSAARPEQAPDAEAERAQRAERRRIRL